MDLLQLKYFQTVAKFNHITKAARELQIAQPALSVTISRLEEDIGVPLFNRTGRNIVLNEYGKIFLKRVNRALNELEAGRQEVTDLSGDEFGSVAIASTSISKQFCASLSSFSQRYPKANFRLTQITDENAKLNLLDTEAVDFVFIIKKVERPGLVFFPLEKKDIFLAVAPNHRFAKRNMVSLQELYEEPFISLKSDYCIEFCHNMCLEKGFSPKVVSSCDSLHGLMNLVSAGFGVSFFPSPDRQKVNLPFVLIKIENFHYESFLYFAWKENHYFSKAALLFREYIMQKNNANTK